LNNKTFAVIEIILKKKKKNILNLNQFWNGSRLGWIKRIKYFLRGKNIKWISRWRRKYKWSWDRLKGGLEK
jgi:hypothetical protein